MLEWHDEGTVVHVGSPNKQRNELLLGAVYTSLDRSRLTGIQWSVTYFEQLKYVFQHQNKS
jgi:hypothetical protein